MNIRYLARWLKAEFEWRVLGKRYEIKLSEEFKRQLAELPEEHRVEIMATLEKLSRNPYIGHRVEWGAEEEKQKRIREGMNP